MFRSVRSHTLSDSRRLRHSLTEAWGPGSRGGSSLLLFSVFMNASGALCPSGAAARKGKILQDLADGFEKRRSLLQLNLVAFVNAPDSLHVGPGEDVASSTTARHLAHRYAVAPDQLTHPSPTQAGLLRHLTKAHGLLASGCAIVPVSKALPKKSVKRDSEVGDSRVASDRAAIPALYRARSSGLPSTRP